MAVLFRRVLPESDFGRDRGQALCPGGREARERRAPKAAIVVRSGHRQPGRRIAQLHKAMGWRLSLVPFFFKVRNGFQFLRGIEYLKRTPLRRSALDAAAYSGVGWAAAKIAGAVLTSRNGHLNTLRLRPREFSPGR